MTRDRIINIGISLLLSSSLLAACGGGDSTTSEPLTEPEEPTAETVTPSEPETPTAPTTPTAPPSAAGTAISPPQVATLRRPKLRRKSTCDRNPRRHPTPLDMA
ncbi:hypothetical protein [Halomicronema sp. CCY15110]|uniref:hypothetical protein n=1 Tax=Halomicronema sp. CCY15110 TaxID=2767773 RepID=UPI001951493F|nr:hypothetical protein [Halomicronema sp. CCY15110]